MSMTRFNECVYEAKLFEAIENFRATLNPAQLLRYNKFDDDIIYACAEEYDGTHDVNDPIFFDVNNVEFVLSELHEFVHYADDEIAVAYGKDEINAMLREPGATHESVTLKLSV